MNEPTFSDVVTDYDPVLNPLTPTEQAAIDARRIAARKAAEIREVAQEGLSHVKDFAENAMDSVRENFEEMKAKSTVYIKSNPTRALMIAAGIGFVFGLATR